ncbi:MAG: B12-binding domain-containing radical SAM protein [Candidatus Sumerlaeia bacterium]|nr:B12-binding domain-containing radical SAM protein [Candidatus Sumerlaeia bacterium]
MSSRPLQSFLVINPPTGLYRRDDRCQSRVEDQTVEVVFAPIDLATYAAVLRARGAVVHLRDYPAQHVGWDRYLDDLRTLQPDAVVVKTTLATLEADLRACEAAKELSRETVAIGVGESLVHRREEILRNHPSLDAVIVGEAEAVLGDLVGLSDFSSIAGLSFRRSSGGAEQIFTTPDRPVLDSLDALPYPARDLLDNDLYRSPETGNRLTVIHAHRGCPSRCIFCPAGSLSGYRVRYRSPENVVGEIRECVERFGIHEFLFHGDTFTIHRRWLVELCQRIVEAKLDIRWGCNSRVDTMDDERAEWMKRAGCWVVAFGVESGSQEMLDKMRKGARVEAARQAVAVCRRHGLRTHAFYLIGLPWENAATLDATFRLARELDTDFFDFNIAYPLPGTEFYDIVHREGLLDAVEYPKAGYARAAARTFYLSREALNTWRRRALLRLSLRPRYIARTLLRAGSPRRALRYLAAAARRLRHILRA